MQARFWAEDKEFAMVCPERRGIGKLGEWYSTDSICVPGSKFSNIAEVEKECVRVPAEAGFDK